jgi:hypothetical protein
MLQRGIFNWTKDIYERKQIIYLFIETFIVIFIHFSFCDIFKSIHDV